MFIPFSSFSPKMSIYHNVIRRCFCFFFLLLFWDCQSFGKANLFYPKLCFQGIHLHRVQFFQTVLKRKCSLASLECKPLLLLPSCREFQILTFIPSKSFFWHLFSQCCLLVCSKVQRERKKTYFIICKSCKNRFQFLQPLFSLGSWEVLNRTIQGFWYIKGAGGTQKSPRKPLMCISSLSPQGYIGNCENLKYVLYGKKTQKQKWEVISQCV